MRCGPEQLGVWMPINYGHVCLSVCTYGGVSACILLYMCLVCVQFSIKAADARQAQFTTMPKPRAEPASRRHESKAIIGYCFFPRGDLTCIHALEVYMSQIDGAAKLPPVAPSNGSPYHLVIHLHLFLSHFHCSVFSCSYLRPLCLTCLYQRERESAEHC